MTTTTANAGSPAAHAGATSAVRGAFASPARGLAQALWGAYARSRTLKALRALDDHMLNDIGLTRGEIGAFEHDHRYDPRLRLWP